MITSRAWTRYKYKVQKSSLWHASNDKIDYINWHIPCPLFIEVLIWQQEPITTKLMVKLKYLVQVCEQETKYFDKTLCEFNASLIMLWWSHN